MDKPIIDRKALRRKFASIDRRLKKLSALVDDVEWFIHGLWDEIDPYHDEWSKDDHPHACCASVRGRGTYRLSFV